MNNDAARASPTPDGCGRYCFARIALFLLFFWGLTFPSQALDTFQNTNSQPVLAAVKWIYTLTPEEAAKKHPVRVQGVVTFYDPEWRILFVQDASSGIYVSWTGEWQKLTPGQQVEIVGTTDPGNYMPVVAAQEILPGKDGGMPIPVKVTLSWLAAGKHDSQWVEVRGRVRSVSNASGRTQLMLAMEGRRAKVLIQNYPNQDSYGLLDADIVVRGVCGTASDSKRQATGFTLFVPGREYIDIEKANPSSPNTLPQRNIASIPTLKSALRGNRIRMLGVIASRDTNHTECVIQDRTGSIRVKTETPNLRLNMFLDVIGYLNTNDPAPRIEDATLRRMGLGSMTTLDATNPTFLSSLSGELFPVIRQAAAVRRLKPAEAEVGYPVQIVGVVTYYDSRYGLLFVQDETSGIFVFTEEPVDIASGQQVRVQGYSAPGDYAPVIKDPCFQILSAASMPAAQSYGYKQLETGSMDSQWIEIQGVIQNQQSDGHLCVMEIGVTNGMSFKTTVLIADSSEIVPDLTGSKVRIRGVCGSNFNSKRQLVGFQVYTPSISHVSVVQSAPNPFELPIQAITNLVQFKPDKTETERERFKGVVTAAQRDGSFFIQDNTGGLLVHLKKPQQIREGDWVEVAGFAELVGLSPSLKNAEFRKISTQVVPAPVDLTPEFESTNSFQDVLQTVSQYDSKRIVVKGTLLNTVDGPVESIFLIQIGSTIVDAHWERPDGERGIKNLRPGSQVQATGVALVKTDRNRAPQSMGMILPSQLSLQVLSPPPRWILERAMMVIGGLLAASLAGSIWTLMLRRKVELQTAIIQKRLERESALEQRYSDLVENAHDIIFTIDTAGNITSMNKSGEAVTGYSRFEAKGIPLAKLLFSNKAIWVEKLIELADSALAHTQTMDLKAKDGTRIVMEASARAVRQEGRLIEIQIIARDISERIFLEMQLRQAQKMESVGQLAAGVAHDFNNILTIIQGHTSMLLNPAPAGTDRIESVREIAAAADRAANLTKQLLAFSRKQMWQPCPLSMHELIHNLARMLGRSLGEHIQLEIRTDSTLPFVLADPGMMEQVIMNLAVNARDAMPDGGLLVITAAAVQADDHFLQTHNEGRAGKFLCIDVIDQGCGMDTDTISHLFEPFFTTKKVGKGSGLGLATAYGIVKQHEGWIEVESKPNRGTAFHIYLPATEKRAESLQKPAEERTESRGTETILLVEDEDQVREMARKILVHCGYSVLTAANGGEALGAWELQKRKPDLLFSDMVMPGGINGRQLAMRLQAKQPGLKVLFASGYSQELNEDASGLQTGINFLPKPYQLQTLIRTVRSCLDA